MPKYVFTGDYPRYYPTLPLFAKHGEVHDIETPPDADWQLAESAVAAPVAPAPTNDTPVTVEAPQAPATAVPDAETLHAAEALLEANPELARKLVEDVKNA